MICRDNHLESIPDSSINMDCAYNAGDCEFESCQYQGFHENGLVETCMKLREAILAAMVSVWAD